MAHVVFITNGMSSLLNSGLEMSRRLRAAGHRTTFVAPEVFAENVTRQGEAFVGVDDGAEHAARAGAERRPSPARPLAVLRWLRDRRALRRASLGGEPLLATLRGLEPDLLLIDIEVHYAVITTAATGIPTALAMNFFSVFRRPGLPPLHAAIQPGDGGQERAIAAAWRRARVGALLRRLGERFGKRRIASMLRPVRFGTYDGNDIRALARRHRFDLRSKADSSQWLRPHVYRHLPIICYNAEEMDLPHEPPAQMYYVGPMVRTDRAEPALPAEQRERWDAIRQARCAADGRTRPLVYCSLGTFFAADRAFLRRVLDAFVARPEWDLVLGLGGTLTANELGDIPANALLLEWAPQLEILAHADCAITHGGVNSLCECVRFGVPMVVFSTKFVDQNGNAARVAHHALGVVADKDATDAAAMERCIEQALTSPDIRDAVESMRERFIACEQEGRAESVVASLLGEVASS